MLIPDLELVEFGLVVPDGEEDRRPPQTGQHHTRSALDNASAKGHQRQALTPVKRAKGAAFPHGPIGLNGSLVEDFLEDILEPPIVGLEDGVLGTHVERPFLLDGVLEAAVGKAHDGLQEAGRVLSGTCGGGGGWP